jgi:hypothetical protein
VIAVIVSEPWSTGLLCLAMWGLCDVVSRLGRFAWGRLQGWAWRRCERRMMPDETRFRKVLRHAPSGRVGLCVGTGFGMHRWLGWLCAEERIQMVMCPACARGILQPGLLAGAAMMSAKMSGHVEVLASREVVAALPSEIEAFKAAMEKSEPEAADE